MRPSRPLLTLALATALSGAASALIARPALAQGGECSVDTYQPAQLAQAGIAIQKAASAATPEAQQKSLRDAYKFLQDEKKTAANPVGTGFLKAQIYILWLHQDGLPERLTREQMNAGGVKSEVVDLVAMSDSLLKAVEATGPACAEQTRQWRASKPWTDRLNKAYSFLNAGATDSADIYARRAAQLYQDSPFVHNIFAQLEDKKGNKDGLLSHLRMAIDLGKSDTSITETRRQMQFQYAANAFNQGITAQSPKKEELLKAATDEYLALFQEQGKGREAAAALSSISDVLISQQDTVRMKAVLAPMVANAAAHDDLTLLIGADMARIGNQNAAAMTLYGAALEQNPNVRDALYFMSYMYYDEKTRDVPKMVVHATRLIELDPTNPDSYQLYAEALRLSAQAEKDAAKKAQLLKDYNAANAKLNTMTTKVGVTQFERRAEGALMTGAIENLGKTAKSYSLTMEFLDEKGAVVESMTTQVANVAAGKAGTFEFKPSKAGIVAYRYKALP